MLRESYEVKAGKFWSQKLAKFKEQHSFLRWQASWGEGVVGVVSVSLLRGQDFVSC